jgi:hypothetical protein
VCEMGHGVASSLLDAAHPDRGCGAGDDRTVRRGGRYGRVL